MSAVLYPNVMWIRYDSAFSLISSNLEGLGVINMKGFL
jgi:hypothetical protein